MGSNRDAGMAGDVTLAGRLASEIRAEARCYTFTPYSIYHGVVMAVW
jgi:hypothetical protein